mgnify:CR=1 FL=1
MTDKAKHILIGLFVITSITIAVAMILFLEPKIGDGKKTLHVRFANISGIVVGTRVTFAGKPVGEVLHIREIPDARTEPDQQGRIYFYELVLQADSSVEVYDTDEIAVRSTGLMGERSVAILPKIGPSAQIVTDKIIYANSTDPLENTFQQISKVAGRMDQAVAHLDTWFQENSAPLSQGVASFHQALEHLGETLSLIEKEQILPGLKQSTDLLNQNLQLIHTSLADEKLLHRTSSLVDNLNTLSHSLAEEGTSTLNHLNQITRSIAEGSGTIGRLIEGDDCYLHLSSLLSKAETLMNDINHYGILFQYDKKWQRSRTKRANILKALETPKDFRTYFEGEIDGITTSLGRLSELMERVENCEDKNRIAENRPFKQQFANLLRQAKSLTDSIQLYNQSLSDSNE